nr:Bacterial regulatory proteins, tetR family [uncultured bacterium]
MVPEPGRRERKKAETRKRIADAALELFIARGFDAVSIREIADTADVSVATLYAHFPSKEALVFDEDDEVRDSLLDAVRNRSTGTSIPDALHRWMLDFVIEDHDYEAHIAQFNALVASVPSLREYERRMWGTIDVALAATITEELGQPAGDKTIAAFAHFVLEAWSLFDRGGQVEAQVNAVFDLLTPGWTAYEASLKR